MGGPRVGNRHKGSCALAFRRKGSDGAGGSDGGDRAEPVNTARPCSKHLIGITSSSCPSNPTRQKLPPPASSTWGNRGPERLNNLPPITQLARDTARIQSQAAWLRRHCV